MSVRITLDDKLANRLQQQAESRNLDLHEWMLVILANAADRPDEPRSWTELNSRRLALIRKKYGKGLVIARLRRLRVG